ncbi:MAG TPA: hypothetical protein HA252_03355 [Candidatus Diapherotrites archaeon]|uniref:Uncharacterized protein n=1 Tax=Candidatus Iainarchaeum sp. TaxID=3101447 RepID=A0A7J4JKH2_9ARCH|nr:hypothetical protein [Candidatus Diapherotrites archaeon]HIH16417.1 hypothetical protein [Candidatus Diapherotrites archaeon]
MELTDKRLVSLLWMLKNKDKTWSILALRKGAVALLNKKDDEVKYKQKTPFPIIDGRSLTYGPTYTFVTKELEKNGYVVKDSKTSEYRVAKASDLVKLISLARPFSGLDTIDYYSPLGFTATLKLLQEAKLPYALTAFAGGELYHPYVKTDQVHAYIREADAGQWENYLRAKNCLRATSKSQANLFLVPTRIESLLGQGQKVKGFQVAPAPILLSDLLSMGGLAEEQGRLLLEEWLDNRM